VRKAAHKGLIQVVNKDDECVVTAAIARLQHKNAGVRQQAVRTLEEIADKGNERAIIAVARACAMGMVR